MNKNRLIIFFLYHHIIITMDLKVRNIDCEKYKNKCSSADFSTLVYLDYIIYNIKNKPRTLLSRTLLHYRDVWNQPSTNISHIFCVILYIYCTISLALFLSSWTRFVHKAVASLLRSKLEMNLAISLRSELFSLVCLAAILLIYYAAWIIAMP